MGYGHLIKINFGSPNSSTLCLQSTIITISMDSDNVKQFKLSVKCDYHAPTYPNNMTSQYFISNPNASDVSLIAVKWCEKNMEIDSNLDDLIATKENYLYQLIPRLLDQLRNNTNNSFSNIKPCILHLTLQLDHM